MLLRKRSGLLLVVVMKVGCGAFEKGDMTECSTGADCVRLVSSSMELRNRWCIARRSGDTRGYCERVACNEVGGWCGTGGRCVAADDVDRAEDPERVGHCEKIDCIAMFCPLLLTCSAKLWCERPVITPEELSYNQAR